MKQRRDVALHITKNLRPLIQLLHLFFGEPLHAVAFFFHDFHHLLLIQRLGDEEEVHVLMRRFIARRARGDFLQQHRDRFDEHRALVPIARKKIRLAVADDFDIEIRLFLALTLGGFLWCFVCIDVPARRHPTPQALVPE